ncbi:MAG: ribulokinase [Candidatus Aminicenantes bacterium]|nr:ribulokinase [Candidatus Aminicenantes bacterium]
MGRYALGLDFGTETVRALVVDCGNGEEAAEAVVPYAHGVITENLPGLREPLPPDFALQHPEDYIDACVAAISGVTKVISPEDIIGVGVDFTACTILPIKRDGTPLMKIEPFRKNPHAWVKLWKHHAAQPEADSVNQRAHERNEPFLKYYSGIISSEWMLPKCWEIANKAIDVYKATDIMIDAGDWLVFQITGKFCRNACAAGYKGLWNAEMGFPSKDYLGALDPKIKDLDEKWLKNIAYPGQHIGGVSESFAARSGLRAGIPVSAATIDAHSGVPGMGVSQEGPICIIMGTSSCHMVLSRELHFFDGYAGVVKDGIIPGFYGYESGQSAVGDIFAWFARDFLKPKGDPFSEISKKAAALRPGESGIIALDWMNGNRSVLMNAHLTGTFIGLMLDTKPEEAYRALIEGTAFGTKIILEAHKDAGIPVRELVVCGGLVKDPLILQIYADVTGLPFKVAASDQAVALGAAMFGAVAAGAENGGHSSFEEAIPSMTKPPVKTYTPTNKAKNVYDKLYQIYMHCHDHFGRECPEIMKRLKEIKAQTRGGLR